MNSDIELHNQQVKTNQVVLLDKARISLDTLQNKDKEKILRIINCLEQFPDSAEIQIHQLKSIPSYFIARAGIYRIIFDFKPGQITIVDIVNHERLEILYNSLKKAEM